MAHTWFLDRTHACKETARQLRAAGIRVVRHQEKYPKRDNLEDPVWIKECASEGLIIISGDKGLELDGINRQAVIQAQAKVFVLQDTQSRGLDWAAALVSGRHKIERIASTNYGPFYVTVEKNNDTHVYNLRFAQGGGAMTPPAPVHEAQMPLSDKPEEPPPPKVAPIARQEVMFDDEKKDE